MNPLTDLANSTTTSAITEAGAMLTGPIGLVVIFFLGFTILGVVITVIYKVFNK